MFLLSHLLKAFIRTGALSLIDAHGRTHTFAGALGPSVTVRLHDNRLPTRLALNPELYAAEAYMDGTLTFEAGSTVYDLLLLFSVNRKTLGAVSSQKVLRQFWHMMRRRHQANSVATAAVNARRHYDVPVEIYRLFLDQGLNYSCAFFHDPDYDTLEAAQQTKLARATAKLGLKPGMRVAEIGSGWGSFAIHIAKTTGAQVVAINVSPEQLRISRALAEEQGVSSLVEFREVDYRALQGRFDRVVSVGMMEHVGFGHFDAYFAKIRDLLTEDGYAFIHCIGRTSPPGTTGPFIRKYIFPGSYVPSLSEVFGATERIGLWVADMEVLRLHYYYTIRHWRDRFARNRDTALALTDERFCRMWEFYLAAVELNFLHGSNMVFQLLLSPKRDAVPIVRDFMLQPAEPVGFERLGAVSR
jgi:cyclopropane-fatty-acyl-phospholipid synthase